MLFLLKAFFFLSQLHNASDRILHEHTVNCQRRTEIDFIKGFLSGLEEISQKEVIFLTPAARSEVENEI